MGARSLGQGLAVCSVSVQRLAPWGPGPGQGSPGRRVSTASTWQHPQLLGTRGSAPARGRAAGNRGGGIPACPAAAEPVARRAASRGAPLRGLQPPRLPGFLRSPQAPSRAHGEPGAGAGAAGQGQRPARARRVPAEHHRALLCVPRGRGDGQLRLGPKPVCHFRQRVPWLHSDPSKETVLLSHQAPGGEAGCRAARGAPRPRGGRGGGRHPAVHRQESLAHAKGQESQHLPQHLGAPRWAHGAGRTVAGGGPAGAAGGDRLAAGAGRVLLEDAGPVGVRVPAHAEQRAAKAAPCCRVPVASFHREPPAAADEDQGGRERGECLRLAGTPRSGVYRSGRGRSREHGARAQQPPPNHQSHGAEWGLGPAHGTSCCDLPEHSTCSGGRCGTGQHRDQVCPSALARHLSRARQVSNEIPGPGLPAGQTAGEWSGRRRRSALSSPPALGPGFTKHGCRGLPRTKFLLTAPSPSRKGRRGVGSLSGPPSYEGSDGQEGKASPEWTRWECQH